MSDLKHTKDSLSIGSSLGADSGNVQQETCRACAIDDIGKNTGDPPKKNRKLATAGNLLRGQATHDTDTSMRHKSSVDVELSTSAPLA